MAAVPPQHWAVEVVGFGAKCVLFAVIATKIIYFYAYIKLLRYIEEEEFQRNIKNENYRPDEQWDQIRKLTKDVKKLRKKRIALLAKVLKTNKNHDDGESLPPQKGQGSLEEDPDSPTGEEMGSSEGGIL